MRRGASFLAIVVALVTMTAGAVENVRAGSAVANDGFGHLATAYGGPKRREEQRALAEALRKYGRGDFRIIAATDVTGFGAIAVARHPDGYRTIIGVSLGKRSATEADTLAIEKCLRAGGKNPQVKWAFHG